MKKTFCYLCDRCHRVLGTDVTFTEQSVIKGLPFISKQKRTKMHFCDERCKLIFLKGRKYYATKKKLEAEAFAKLLHASGKCL